LRTTLRGSLVNVTAGTLTLNKWQMGTFTYDGTTLNLYLNGALVGSATGSATINSSVDLWIGKRILNNNTFVGRIDDVRVYNRALSAQEVQQLYNSGGGTIAHSNTTLSTGLAGYWPFDGKTTNWAIGQTTDMSGSGNTGSLINMSTTTTPTAGKIGGALNFNGSSTYVTTPTQSISGSITVSAWVYSTNFNQTGFIVGKNPVNTQWELFFEGSVLRWRGGAADNTVFCSNPSNNKWHHIVGMQTGTTGTLYIDGVQCSSGTLTAIGNGSGTIDIGRFSSGYYFKGAIDDVRIYKRVLSPSEVKQLYINGGGVVAHSNSVTLSNGLVGYLPLDGNLTNWVTGITNDLSGNGNSGTLNGLSTSTTPIAGKVGGAMKFSGATTQYVQAGGFTNLGTSNQPYTLAAWVKPTKASETGDILHVSANATGLGWCISMLQISGGKAKALSWLPNPSIATGATTLSANTWYHIVNTWSASGGLQLYVNGALDATTAQATFSGSGLSDYVSVGSPVTGGTCSGDAGTGFAGGIDDVRVYNRAFSAAEVQQLYAATK
ncbi:MAG TPA: LamG domain-containing protein, partial [Candidatus Paceibacterota bacterium]